MQALPLRCRRQELACGQDQRLAHIFRAALGAYIKYAHGVDLIAEKFHAHRLRHGGRENIQNAAAQGELSRALHRRRALVTGGNQLFRKLIQLKALAHAEGKAAFQ